MSNNIEEDIKEITDLIDVAEIVLPKYSTSKITYRISESQKIAISNIINQHKKDKEALNLLNGMKKKYKISLFMIIRNSLVLPKGKLLGETDKEINQMSYETLCEVITMTDFKIAEKMYEEGKRK